MRISEAIAKDLGIPEKMIHDALAVSRSYVKIFRIRKHSGGYREIYHPSKKLKTIQYWLIYNILDKLPIHESAMAFREGISILHNAKRHCKNRFFLKMDFKDFFPSIKFDDLFPIIKQWYSESSVEWALDEEAKELIRKACFFKEDRLAIGYPSSPVISNAVMYAFDVKITGLISEERFGNTIYTRYADDLVLSTDKKGVCREIRKLVEELVVEHKSPDIVINNAKTKLGSSTGGTASVTGLKVCGNGHVTLHRKQKDHIRLMLSLYSKGTLNENEYRSLLGHLAYCQYVSPLFFSNLSRKYFRQIHELRSKDI